jgi:hypothetical protein
MASSNSTLQGLLNSVVREVRHPRFTSDFTWSFVVTCAIGGVTLLLMFLTDINQIKETRRETEEETATYRYEGEKDESGLPNGWGEMQWSDGEAYEVRRLLSVFIALHCLIFCAVRRVNGRTAHEKAMARCFLPTAMYLWGTLRTMHDMESESMPIFSQVIRKYQIMLSESV